MGLVLDISRHKGIEGLGNGRSRVKKKLNPALGKERLLRGVNLLLSGSLGSGSAKLLLLLLKAGLLSGGLLAEFLGFDLREAGKGEEGREVSMHLRVVLVEGGMDLLGAGGDRGNGSRLRRLRVEELEAVHRETSGGDLGKRGLSAAGEGRREREDGGKGSFVGLGLHGRRNLVQAAGGGGGGGQETDGLALHFDSLFLAELGQDEADSISVGDKGNRVSVAGDSLLITKEREAMLVGTNEVNA